MAENPIGTVAEEERLIPLRTDGDAFYVEVTEPAAVAGVPTKDPVAWTLDPDPAPSEAVDEEANAPRLYVGAASDEDRDDAAHTRLPSEEGGTITVEVPRPLLAEGGLGIDLEAYDDGNPLLFEPEVLEEPVAATVDENVPAPLLDPVVGLVPVRFDDGTPYRDEPLPETDRESDPVVEAHLDSEADSAPRPETASVPIDPEVIERVVETDDVSRSDLVDALEAIQRADVVDESDTANEYAPLTAEDRMVIVVDPETWERIADVVEIDPDALDAARRAHERQAEELVQRADASEYHGFAAEYDAVVARP